MIEDASGDRISYGLIAAVIVAIVIVVAAGLHLIETLVSDVLDALGPATECGALLAERAQASQRAGMSRCDSLIRAIDEVSSSPRTPCPHLGKSPATQGIYAQYLYEVGCAPESQGLSAARW